MRKRDCAFTIVELLVSVAVLVVLVLLIGRLFSSAATVTTSGNKRMDAEAQIRPLFERMAVDLSQMIKRSDVDYYLKSSANTQSGNDQIAFYSAANAYYPCSSCPSPSPISIIVYRINAENQLERGAKQLPWNGVASTPSTSQIAMVFGLAGGDNGNLPVSINNIWAAATNSNADIDYYDLIGPYVFRFEYYYLLKNGSLSTTPWDTSGHISGMQDVAAIALAIAAIDPKSRVLISDSQLTTLVGRLPDFSASMKPGDLLNQWQSALDGTSDMPRPAIQGVRIYERYFYLAPKS
jgi:hypothetical protein